MMAIAFRWRQCGIDASSVAFACVEPGFELVDEDEIEGIDEAGEAAIARERFVPAEVPRRRDVVLPKTADDAGPLRAVVRVEAEVHVQV